jgi:hypothetical protein
MPLSIPPKTMARRARGAPACHEPSTRRACRIASVGEVRWRHHEISTPVDFCIWQRALSCRPHRASLGRRATRRGPCAGSFPFRQAAETTPWREELRAPGECWRPKLAPPASRDDPSLSAASRLSGYPAAARRTMPTSPQTHPQVCIGAGETSGRSARRPIAAHRRLRRQVADICLRGARGDDHGMPSTPGTTITDIGRQALPLA